MNSQLVAVLLLYVITYATGFGYETAVDDYNLVTVTSTITRTHTIRIQTTSDVLVTSAVFVPQTVTQYETRRDYVRDDPNTVTSFIRVTAQPVVIETRTVEKFPVRTVVSRFTDFRTVTSTVEFWQPITHYSTSFEVLRLPIEETQILYQVAYETVTTTSTIAVTVTQGYGHGRKFIY